MQGQSNPSILRPRLQRQLRRAMTDAEQHLWRHLRMRQLDGCKFRRQHPVGDYIVDFVCLERHLVVELDGGQHADRVEQDAKRTASLEASDFQVLRFWNDAVFRELDAVLALIHGTLVALAEVGIPSPLNRLAGKATPSPPNPPLEGEG